MVSVLLNPKVSSQHLYGEPLAKFISCCLWRHFLVLFSRNHILSGFPPTAWALLLNLLSGLLLTSQLLKVGVAWEAVFFPLHFSVFIRLVILSSALDFSAIYVAFSDVVMAAKYLFLA